MQAPPPTPRQCHLHTQTYTHREEYPHRHTHTLTQVNTKVSAQASTHAPTHNTASCTHKQGKHGERSPGRGHVACGDDAAPSVQRVPAGSARRRSRRQLRRRGRRAPRERRLAEPQLLRHRADAKRQQGTRIRTQLRSPTAGGNGVRTCVTSTPRLLMDAPSPPARMPGRYGASTRLRSMTPFLLSSS